MSISVDAATISVRRGSPYSALRASSSSRMIFITRASEARISFRRAISLENFFVLLDYLVALEAREALELHVQDGLGLKVRRA